MIEQSRDKTLVKGICIGDKQSLGQLYDLHSNRLMQTAYYILKNRDDAEDLLHDVFLEVWKTAKSYDATRGSVLSWLMIKMRSRALDRWRALQRRAQKEGAEWTEEFDATNDLWEQHDNANSIYRALEKLPELQRTAVQLSYYQGLTYEEIAAHAEVPVGTIKSRLANGISKLNRYLINSMGITHE